MSRWERPDPHLGSYLQMVSHQWWLLLLCALAGLGAAAMLQAQQGTPTQANQAVFVAPTNGQGLPGGDDFTLDTEARLVESDPVLDALRKVQRSNTPTDQLVANVNMSVTPNTRILHIQFTSNDPAKARAGAAAAADAYLKMRAAMLVAGRRREVATLKARSDLLAQQFAVARSNRLAAGDWANGRLRKSVVRLMYQNRYTLTTSASLANAPINPGQLLGPPVAKRNSDGLLIACTSGTSLGLILGIALGWVFEGSCARAGGSRRKRLPATLPVLATVQPFPRATPSDLSETLGEARLVLKTYAPLCGVVAVSESSAARQVAAALSVDLVPQVHRESRPRVMLVASRRTNRQQLLRTREALRQARQDVVGLILVNPA